MKPKDAGGSPPLRKSATRSSQWARHGLALSGFGIITFLTIHSVGNLLIFSDAERFNDYAHWLRTLLAPIFGYEGFLWIVRVALLILLVLHILCTHVIVSRLNSDVAAGLIPKMQGTNWLTEIARKVARPAGFIVIGFVAFHLLDLTFGYLVQSGSFRPEAGSQFFAYENIIASLERPIVTLVYIVGIIAVGMHVIQGLGAVIRYDLGRNFSRRAHVLIFHLSTTYSIIYIVVNVAIVGFAALTSS